MTFRSFPQTSHKRESGTSHPLPPRGRDPELVLSLDQRRNEIVGARLHAREGNGLNCLERVPASTPGRRTQPPAARRFPARLFGVRAIQERDGCSDHGTVRTEESL